MRNLERLSWNRLRPIRNRLRRRLNLRTLPIPETNRLSHPDPGGTRSIIESQALIRSPLMDKWTRAFLALLFLCLGLVSARAAAPDTPAGGPTNAANLTIAATTPTNAIAIVATNVAPAASVPASDILSPAQAETLRSYLRLQEQLHAALLAIQQSRSDASSEAQTNVGLMMARLEAMEKELAEQRSAQVRSAQDSNRTLILAAAGIFLLGVIAMIITALIQARGMNRLAEVAVGFGRGAAGGHDSIPLALGNGGPAWLLGNGNGHDHSPGPEGGRLQSTIRQLETRIREIEVVADPSPDVRPGPSDANVKSVATATPAAAHARAIVLAKIQTLFNLGQHQAALAELDDAIGREPADAEWRVKKGMALERLKRFDQALDELDRALALDDRCTQAYLSKGSILNQQARYQEALACYELALAHRPGAA